MSEEEEIAKRGFSVVDKRGKSFTPEKPVAVNDQVSHENLVTKDRAWKSNGFEVVPSLLRDGSTILLGRASGLATDENVFVADYALGVVNPQYPKIRWEKGFDWTVFAMRRLDSFLQCPCAPQSGPCPYHKRMAPQGWMKEDIDRLKEDGLRAVPEVIEILSKAERARQQATRILAPRR